MDPKIQTEKFIEKKEKTSVTVEQIVESDLSLPDYYGDIVKILSCSCSANITSAAAAGDKAVVDGNADIRMLFISGEGKTEICELSYPFSRDADVKDPQENDVVYAQVVSEQITCRAVNPRRADIRGSLTIKISVFGVEEKTIVSDADPDFCHTLKNHAEGSFLSGFIQKTFYLNDTAEIKDNLKAVKIYRACVLPAVNEVKTIKNKMMIKGNARADIVFLSDNGSFVTQSVVVPVSQIADMDGIDENTECRVVLKCMSLDAKLSPDSPNTPSKLEISMILTAFIDAYKARSFSAVSDAYSSRCELVSADKTVKCISSLARVNENFTVTSKMDFSSCKGERLLDAAVRKIRYTVQTEADSVILKGNINFGLILETAESERLYLERVADFEYRKQLTEQSECAEFDPVITPNAVNVSVASDFSAVVNTELHIDGYIISGREIKCLSELNEGKDISRNSDDGVITVYFASKDESLWNIAKSHGTGVEVIKSLNGLTEDCLAEDKMLVFPLE
ncbi:MAG: DUF3794 domain-containing protein [Clostridiales bacterium]|nr:DUF3794 domain-containing protein [Clostridiales bacterium]